MCFNGAILDIGAIGGVGCVIETHISPSDRFFLEKKYVAISHRSGAYVGERDLLLSTIRQGWLFVNCVCPELIRCPEFWVLQVLCVWQEGDLPSHSLSCNCHLRTPTQNGDVQKK